MKDGFVKIGAASVDIRVADVNNNCKSCIEAARLAAEQGVKVVVLPELTLTGATAGDLFFQSTLLTAAERALADFAEQTADFQIVSVVGLPVMLGGNLYNGAAVVYGGDILGICAKNILSRDEQRYFTAGPDENCVISFAGQECLFGSKITFYPECMPSMSMGVCIGSEIFEPMSSARMHAVCGATLIANPAFAYEAVGRSEMTRIKMMAESHSLCAVIASAYAGRGESGTDGICSGECLIAERGVIKAESERFATSAVYTDCDFDALLYERLKNPGFEADGDEYESVAFDMEFCDTPLTCHIPRSPFIPEDVAQLEKRCELILGIQANALADRIKRSYSKSAVIGVSGGLDSTLALLVAVRAFDILKLDRKNIIAVTMPCFGTTERTKGNAEKLSEALGASLRCIDIKEAVTVHFKDIGHDPESYNAVYENAQARERTQVLMDIANAEGGLVIGTGDLSELALGWATYNGDHMSMYGVNGALPKTLMRYMVAHFAQSLENEGAVKSAEILRDVLATPVSPELLPPKDGEIAQCTEGIVGPYELHDFFLYYTVRWGFSPAKILRIATHAFSGVYDGEFIKGWLKVFVKRFISQQFKRSCLPDGPSIGSVSLSPRAGFKMPSDAPASLWLSEIEDSNE